jgi:hypothetical protein
MILADQWYTSGTFWTAAGTVAVLTTGAIATFITLWLANPVRRLECVMSAAPLLQETAQEMPGSLQITWNGGELKDPHILEVNLISRGHKDIASQDFDQPLEFRVGAEILAVLRTASSPNSSAFRTVSFEDDLLKVGPGLIRRKQSIKFTLLAVGPDPVLSSSAAALRDVDVEVLSIEASNHRWPAKTKLAASLAITAITAGLVLIGLVIGHRNPALKNPPASRSISSSAPQLVALHSAEKDLKSGSQATQINGISALQRLIGTTPGVQPAAMLALAEFISAKSPAGSNDQPVTHTIQLALNALRASNPANDGDTTINLSNTNLTSANLSGIDLDNASLVNTDFDTANLGSADLRDADLNYAFVGGANLNGTNLNGANLANASFYETIMCRNSSPIQPQRGYNCSAD